MKTLSEAFDDAAVKHCNEDGCYVGTCPVNCLASLVGKHLKNKDVWMIYGDYAVAKRLGK